jgi:hypothetical protein
MQLDFRALRDLETSRQASLPSLCSTDKTFTKQSDITILPAPCCCVVSALSLGSEFLSHVSGADVEAPLPLQLFRRRQAHKVLFSIGFCLCLFISPFEMYVIEKVTSGYVGVGLISVNSKLQAGTAFGQFFFHRN